MSAIVTFEKALVLMVHKGDVAFWTGLDGVAVSTLEYRVALSVHEEKDVPSVLDTGDSGIHRPFGEMRSSLFCGFHIDDLYPWPLSLTIRGEGGILSDSGVMERLQGRARGGEEHGGLFQIPAHHGDIPGVISETLKVLVRLVMLLQYGDK
jgi:hypothetical protein